MADYWKSQPRHHCDFCKCWIADNKPSKDFHENGKKHQENVKKKIDDVRKKSQKDLKAKQEMSDSIREMEEAALAAFKEDVKKDPSLASQYGITIPANAKIVDKSDVKEGPVPQPKESTDADNDSLQQKAAEEWSEASTPEGYTYYWNTLTGESRWEKPPGYVPLSERESVKPSKSEKRPSKSKDPAVPKKRKAGPLPKEKSEEQVVEFGPAPKAQAYSSWEEVQVEEEPLPELGLPQKKEEEPEKVIIVQEPKIKFREKKVSSLGNDMVGFKKRKVNKGSLQIRRRDDS